MRRMNEIGEHQPEQNFRTLGLMHGRFDFSSMTTIMVALAIAAVFVGVLLGTTDYPLRTHSDEIAKVDAILNGGNPSYHPILMLQIVRAVRIWTTLSSS